MKKPTTITRRALVGMMLACSLVAGLAASSLAVVFSDTGSSPFETEIDNITDAGCASGFPDGTFRPTEDVKRQQFAFWLDNCASRSTRATMPNISGLSTAFQTVDNPSIHIGGVAGFNQYLVVSGWYRLNDAGTECVCDVEIRVFLDGQGVPDQTSQSPIVTVDNGAGGDVDDTVYYTVRFRVLTDSTYVVATQGRVFNSAAACAGNCLSLDASEVVAWTVPFGSLGGQPESGGPESGGVDTEVGTNAVLNPTGVIDG
jgi:S-layer homology domain